MCMDIYNLCFCSSPPLRRAGGASGGGHAGGRFGGRVPDRPWAGPETSYGHPPQHFMPSPPPPPQPLMLDINQVCIRCVCSICRFCNVFVNFCLFSQVAASVPLGRREVWPYPPIYTPAPPLSCQVLTLVSTFIESIDCFKSGGSPTFLQLPTNLRNS